MQSGRGLLARAAARIGDFNRLKLFFADQGYSGLSMWEWVKNTFRRLNWKLEIVTKIHKKVFEALPKRWIVERTFAWLNLYRRLSKDYEYLTKSSETMIMVTIIHIMLNKLDK